MNWKPNKWIATAIGLFFGPLAAVYAGAPMVAAFMLLGLLALVACLFFFAGAAFNSSSLLLRLVFGLGSMALGYFLAVHAKEKAVRPRYTRWYGLTGIFALTVLAATTFRVFLYEPFRFPTSSMAPTAKVGTHLIVQKWGFGHFSTYGITLARRAPAARVKRGDIIVFDFPMEPGDAFVKRVVGLPGDTIVYRDREVFVNGHGTRGRQQDDYLMEDTLQYFLRFEEKLDDQVHYILVRTDGPRQLPSPQPFAHMEKCSFNPAEIKCEVPANNYFVLGDNRDNSVDSRMWGFVPSTAVIGKVVHITQ